MSLSESLTSEDLALFARLGIESELLAAASIFRVTDAEARKYGFSLADRATADLAGVVFPYFDPVAYHRVTARLRRDHPEVDSEGKVQNKYITAWGDNRHLYFPPGVDALLSDATVPIAFVESEKSALALTALADRHRRRLLAVATGGCWGWRGKTGIEAGPNGERVEVKGPLPDFGLLRLSGRKVLLAFDSNVISNPRVRDACTALAENLAGWEAQVCFVALPEMEGVNGPDDLVEHAGDKEMLALLDRAEPFTRPAITLQPGKLPEIVDKAEDVLLSCAERRRVFQRGTDLVRIISLSEPRTSCGLKRPAGTVLLEPLSTIALTDIFGRIVRWQRVNKKGEAHDADCPPQVATTYCSRTGSWRLPVLEGVITAPIMRPDGTVLHRAGYDPETGLFLTEDWPELGSNPTRDDALAALHEIEGVFSEFPFITSADCSVLVAAIVTALQRRSLPTAPLFGFSAPAQRTGKSLLAECVAMIGIGREAPAMAVSESREEIRKAVVAVLREGHAIINLDNIEHPLKSPDLSRAITQPIYQDRVLGESRTIRVPTNVLWTATGNNLTFRGDLVVRALLCQLDARIERPEERQFKITDLRRYVAQHRKTLVAAAMTILRAYVTAGRPDQGLKAWGGFEEWSATVRAPLVWLGMADPYGTRQHLFEDDPDREQAAAALSGWHAAFGEKTVLIGSVIEPAGSDEKLKSALVPVAASKNDANQLDSRRLSHWCREWRGRIIGGFRLEKGKDYGSHATWFVKYGALSTISADSLNRRTHKCGEHRSPLARN
jgi:hypothetical protein